MIVVITDPITNNFVTNRNEHPYILEGQGHNAVKIYFESQESMQSYLQNKNQPTSTVA